VRRRAARGALLSIGLAVSALFAYFAVRDVHPGEVWRALGDCNYWWLVPAFGVLAGANLLRVYRWRFLFSHETRPPFRPLASAMLIGQLFNNVLPARAGEPARIVVLNQSAGTSRAETAGTVLIERAYDVLSLLLLLFVLTPWLPHVTWLRAAAVLAIALSVGLVAAFAVVAVWKERPLLALLGPLERLPFVPERRLEGAAVNLVHGLAGLRRGRLAVAAIALTTASWAGFGISAWLVLRGFDVGRQLSPVAGILVMIAIGLAMILPASPGGVGVFEAAVLVALNAYGVPDSRALSYALVLHALNFFPYVAAGGLLLQLHAASLRGRATGAVSSRS
jgi:glycosyltransferase 2 family protein